MKEEAMQDNITITEFHQGLFVFCGDLLLERMPSVHRYCYAGEKCALFSPLKSH